MDNHINTSACFPNRTPPAGYRVVAWHRDHSESLVTLAENCRQAVCLAKAFCQAIEADRRQNGIFAVRVEEWVGFLTEGEWQPVSERHGGFFHRVAKRQPRHEQQRNGTVHEPGNGVLPKAGDKVQCVLLDDKTCKGGWIARLLRADMAGPITNSVDVSELAGAGQVVTLYVGAISHDHKHIQFKWEPSGDHDRV